MILNIFTDGGARGNPGPAAIGVVIKDEKNTILSEIGKTIGNATNNVAEYTAVVEALESVKRQVISDKIERIQFFLDSTLVVNQLNGLFKVKDANLRNYIVKIRELEEDVGGNIFYKYIPREKNWQADMLVNQALDQT